jgi:hypothetical protein
MKPGEPICFRARVESHLKGCTQVRLERIECVWDVPTEKIPFHLRPLGSLVVLRGQYFRAEASDSAVDLRAAVAEMFEVVDPNDAAY